MKLFIIGNGFDLGHNLSTTYWNFRKFLEIQHPAFLSEFETAYDLYESSSDTERKKILWDEFELRLSCIHEDEIVEQITHFDLGVEPSDIGIEDTLSAMLREKYGYIRKLSGYLKQWVRTIKIRDCHRVTSLVDKDNHDFFITFNYTAVLENVYSIPNEDVLHIHGSLRNYTPEPIIGHGNYECIRKMQVRHKEAQERLDERMCSVTIALKEYYQTTYKDVASYKNSLSVLQSKNIDEIIVIGHSLGDVDLPYFSEIDRLTGKNRMWTVYCTKSEEYEKRTALICAGIDESRILTREQNDFYDLASTD